MAKSKADMVAEALEEYQIGDPVSTFIQTRDLHAYLQHRNDGTSDE